MKIYLQRHAHSEDGDRMDDSRGLTDIGVEQCAVMRKFLKKANIRPDLIICSKFKRAIETSEEMQRKDTPIKQTSALDPVEFSVDIDTAKAWTAILELAGDAKSLLVITHGPLIQPLLASVVFELSERFEWEHASVAYINTNEGEPGEQTKVFRWYATPKLAAHIVGHPDPKSVETPQEELVEALVLAEQLGGLAIPEHRAIIDPLVARVAKGLRIRWRAQLKILEEKGLPNLKDAMDARTTLPSPASAPQGEKDKALAVIPMRHSGFQVKFRKAVRAAYDAGASRAAGQLPEKAISYQASDARLMQDARLTTSDFGHSLEEEKQVVEAPRKPTLPGPTREPEELEDDLDQTTTERTGNLIDQAFKDGIGYAALVLATREMFNGWGTGGVSRAETTALMEVSGAYHDGGRDVARDYPQDVEKLWEIEDDDACEECQANADMDWIPDDAPFDSGDFEPPAHPNCRCSVSYRTAESEEEG